MIRYVFKVDHLYEDQIRLIKAFVDGKNIFFSAPTGYGKSIVYQSLPWTFDVLNELRGHVHIHVATDNVESTL